jgi:sulfate permease, SulP family
VLFLRKVAVPELVEYGADASGDVKPLQAGEAEHPSISIVHVEGELFFGATELFRDQLRRVSENPNLRAVVLKMRNAHHLDATSILALEELHHSMREKDRYLLISEARKDAIRIFRNSGFLDTLGRENMFPDNPGNPTLSTAKALRRASQLLGDSRAEINIFVGTQRKKAKAAQGGDS